MSGEFDPNRNNDRSKDGGGPQDINSLGGEGGLFGRVPSRSWVGSANKSQGQPLGDQGQPIGRQGQAQARGGLGQAQGSQAQECVKQASGLLSMLGWVPSHVSVAASAVSNAAIPTIEYFGTTCCLVVEINAHWVICPKHACGAHGSHDYACYQEAAAKALPHLFALARHFHPTNAEGEPSNKCANLQSKYTGNLAKIKTLKWQMDEWDIVGLFVISDLVDPYALPVKELWGNRKLTGVRTWVSLPCHNAETGNVTSSTMHAQIDLTSME